MDRTRAHVVHEPSVAHLREAPVRAAILDLVALHGELPVGELHALLGVGWGTFHHHLTRLEAAGLVRTVAAGRRRLVHLAHAPTQPHEAVALLRGRTARRVALLVLQSPGIGVAELTRASGGTPRAVYYHVKRLVDAGLVQPGGGGSRYEHLAPTPLLSGLLRAPGC